MDDGTHHTPVEPAASAKPTFLPFKTALPYARSLKLKNKIAWEAFSKSGARPVNVPSNPARAYKHEGWQGYGHWLGTGNLHTKVFLPFKQALLHVRSLKLQNMKEWAQWCKGKARPGNIPSAPNATYKHDGWQGCGHWLGNGNVGVFKDHTFLPFKNALLYACSTKLKDVTDWEAWSKSRPTYPLTHAKSTSTMGGKGTGTGWAQATLACPQTSNSCRSRRHYFVLAPSS